MPCEVCGSIPCECDRDPEPDPYQFDDDPTMFGYDGDAH